MAISLGLGDRIISIDDTMADTELKYHYQLCALDVLCQWMQRRNPTVDEMFSAIEPYVSRLKRGTSTQPVQECCNATESFILSQKVEDAEMDIFLEREGVRKCLVRHCDLLAIALGMAGYINYISSVRPKESRPAVLLRLWCREEREHTWSKLTSALNISGVFVKYN